MRVRIVDIALGAAEMPESCKLLPNLKIITPPRSRRLYFLGGLFVAVNGIFLFRNHSLFLTHGFPRGNTTISLGIWLLLLVGLETLLFRSMGHIGLCRRALNISQRPVYNRFYFFHPFFFRTLLSWRDRQALREMDELRTSNA
jgi:hypothetical protein